MKQVFQPYVVNNLRLRLLTHDDLPFTLEWRNREGVREQFGNANALTWEQHAGWFQRYLDKPDDLVFIVEGVQAGARIGQAAIYAIDTEAGNAEIGRFVVAPEFKGKGLMRQAISALMDFARDSLGLAAVYLEVRVTNEHARRLYERLGFVEVAQADGMVRMERRINDHV